ncbi:hypothetical protein PR202_ga31583 [Eleusine coracana subsp. coracana]|uniref:Uncharacterized protein n=1 Tax=Eleusine coracana subsp. coracana TaxID=191504 RepID=A0AAV5DS30_ELECO|nr:hypothetical protein PR202_ga31583 [Eleusine coracana subsp. coracana]
MPSTTHPTTSSTASRSGPYTHYVFSRRVDQGRPRGLPRRPCAPARCRPTITSRDSDTRRARAAALTRLRAPARVHTTTTAEEQPPPHCGEKGRGHRRPKITRRPHKPLRLPFPLSSSLPRDPLPRRPPAFPAGEPAFAPGTVLLRLPPSAAGVGWRRRRRCRRVEGRAGGGRSLGRAYLSAAVSVRRSPLCFLEPSEGGVRRRGGEKGVGAFPRCCIGWRRARRSSAAADSRSPWHRAVTPPPP